MHEEFSESHYRHSGAEKTEKGSACVSNSKQRQMLSVQPMRKWECCLLRADFLLLAVSVRYRVMSHSLSPEENIRYPGNGTADSRVFPDVGSRS